MVNVILTHEVKDLAEWRKGFEAGEHSRAEAGVKTAGIYTSVDNPNLISVMTEFPSIEVVHVFLQNPTLKEDMESAGVIGMPEVKILNKIQ
ncbi:MAG TPA: hypothetical protein VGK10_09590 [Prolixibacteraceae bacterium]|jgi:quinol monooxygenase YgiN